MLCKYYLQLGCYAIDTENPDCMDVSRMIKNLESIKFSFSRVDLGGVVRKCGSSLEFTGKAYDAIIAHYEENYLQSKGVFAMYMADNNWNYSKVWECPLDFATLQYNANVVTIGCVDNSAAAIIKANKKSKYEFNVSSLKDSSSLLYNGVITQRHFAFNVTGASAGETTTDMKSSKNIEITSRGYYSLYIPGVYVSTDGFSSEKVSAYDQAEDSTWSTSAQGKNDGLLMKGLIDSGRAGFLTCLEDCSIHIDMEVHFWFQYAQWWSYLPKSTYFILVIDDTVVWRMQVTDYYNINVSIHSDFNMVAGQKMAFGMSVLSNESNWQGHSIPNHGLNPNTHLIFNPDLLWESNTNTVSVSESHYEDEPINIDVVKPASLLQKLLDKMFAKREDIYVVGHINEEDTILSRTLLVAAESIRGITTNKIYSSFTEFCEFMEVVFGYVYVLEDFGYKMDRELRMLDDGEKGTLHYIKKSYLTNPSMSNTSDIGYYKMLPIGGIISENLGSNLDMTTPFEYEWEGGHDVAFLEDVFYNDYANTFVVQDWNTGKYYANFTRRDAVPQGSWYNDENGHAREMIGIDAGTFYSLDGKHLYGIIRNGNIVFCDEMHDVSWLDSKENNDYIIDLTFKHRRDIFKSGTTKVLSAVNNLSYYLDEGKVYSDIEVGYPKEDYDNANSGLNEFNFTNYYKTDSDLTEQTLTLICPYRADCYGIEELLVKRNNSESTESDNDIFIVIASAEQTVDGCWQLDRSIEVQNAFTETVFNAAIAPNKIILNNEEYLGSFAKRLKFTSSDANSSAIIGGTLMSANINITKQLFKVGKISIDTNDHSFPETWDGLIEFAYAGKTYKGYLDSIDICFANLGTITYNIIEKCIE